MSIRQRLKRLEKQNASRGQQVPCGMVFVERDGRLTSPNGEPLGDLPVGQGVVLLSRPCVTVEEWQAEVDEAARHSGEPIELPNLE